MSNKDLISNKKLEDVAMLALAQQAVGPCPLPHHPAIVRLH